MEVNTESVIANSCSCDTSGDPKAILDTITIGVNILLNVAIDTQ